MTEYLIMPLPTDLVKVEASDIHEAQNKYRKSMPDMNEDELIIFNLSFIQKTFQGVILPLHKCNITEIK